MVQTQALDLAYIVIDFDIPDEHGNKCFEKNLEKLQTSSHPIALAISDMDKSVSSKSFFVEVIFSLSIYSFGVIFSYFTKRL